MPKIAKSFPKFSLLLLCLVLLLSSVNGVKANPLPAIQPSDTLPVVGNSDSYPNTGSAGKAWANPDGPHSTYDWPLEFSRMGHTLPSYQRYGNLNDAYFHHGIDMVTPNYGVPVYTRSGGQVVNVENYGSGLLYWEVAILDPEGYVWQYHHVDKDTIPQNIWAAFQAYQANPATGGFVPANTYIGGVVNWTVWAIDQYFHHIHLNVLAAGDIYINPLEFHKPGNFKDTQDPIIHEIGLLDGNTLMPGNTVSKGTSYSLYLKASDLYLSEVYDLPPHRIEFMLDESGEWITFWDFRKMPGGADDTLYVNDLYIPNLTKGDYENREFYFDLGFTTEGSRAFPDEVGMHTIKVRVSDYAGNSNEDTYTWFVSETIKDNGCTSRQGITKTFTSTRTRPVEDIDLKLMLSHEERGQVWVSLKGPGDVTQTYIVNTSNDTKSHFNVTINDHTTEPLHNGQNDTLGEPIFGRQAGPSRDGNLAKFFGRSAEGEWTVFVCDHSSGKVGELIMLELDLHLADNLQPIANAKTLTGAYGIALPITLEGSDPDNDPITFHLKDEPTHGSLTGNAPNLIYTPQPGFVGLDSFTFVVSDGDLESEPARITILVLPGLFVPIVINAD